MLNIYGSSEVAADATCHEVCERDFASSVAIGRPISNTEVYLVDECWNPVPIGIRGEIYIGGEGLARGYLNRPKLTAERFVSNWLAPEQSPRLYRTGDLGRFRNNGEIEYLGRVDSQIKLRGQRVELGEIESIRASAIARFGKRWWQWREKLRSRDYQPTWCCTQGPMRWEQESCGGRCG